MRQEAWYNRMSLIPPPCNLYSSEKRYFVVFKKAWDGLRTKAFCPPCTNCHLSQPIFLPRLLEGL